jgi:inner membrane protein
MERVMIGKAMMVKLAALLVVLLLLAVGLSAIGGVTAERVRQRSFAVASIAQSAAGPQVLAGPVISRTCVQESTLSKVIDGKTVSETVRESMVLRAFPAALEWRGEVGVEPRRRSLYTVNTYLASLAGVAQFKSLQGLATPVVEPKNKISCGEPHLAVLLSHQSGIQSAEVKINGALMTLTSGGVDGVAGFSVALPGLTEASAQAKAMTIEVKLDLLGMERLSLMPVGDDNTLKLGSKWPHPSFAGAFLPRDKTISEQGFSANWRVSSLATDAQTRFPCGVAGAAKMECAEGMAVAFVDPVNPTALSERAVKYGELFIALTFVGLGLFELLRRIKVHPVQYLLIGAALAVFFLLLLSVSEHLPFATAYGLAALGCTLLIGVYAKSVLGGWRGAAPVTGGCATLYGVLYLVLQSEQHALLAGSLLIFAVLAAVMLSTRNIRWGTVTAASAEPGGE